MESQEMNTDVGAKQAADDLTISKSFHHAPLKSCRGTVYKDAGEDPVEKGMDGEHQNGKTAAKNPDH
jgi:hypothetical protein